MSRLPAKPPRFSHHMVTEVRETVRAGYGSDADIAAQLAAVFDDRITALDVARWRREFPRFNNACANSVREANIVLSGVAYRLARDGSENMLKHWLDRRHPAFMPKSRTDIRGGGTLDEALRARMSEDDLRRDGTISDGDYGDEG